MHLVDNTGDTVNLTVDLPPHAHWVGKPPPAHSTLGNDLNGTWTYKTTS